MESFSPPDDAMINAKLPLPRTADTSQAQYKTIRVLGHGAYAWVEEVKDENQGHVAAMKVIPVPRSRREETKQRIQEEVKILQVLSGHYHIVKFQCAFAEPRGFCIVVSPVADCDLAVFYDRCASDLYPDQMFQPIRMWFSCLAGALHFIHSHRIRHKGT